MRPFRHPGSRNAAGAVRRRDQGGFALFEALVAVAVLAVLAATLPGSIVAARQSAERSDAWLHARLVAETVAAEELSAPGLRPGSRSGVLQGRRWTIAAAPSGRLSVPGQTRLLLNIRLAVEVSPTETLTIDTMRIGASR